MRELQTALSVNKSELARILRVSRPTVYDWLDDGQPNPGNVSRIRTLRRMLRESRVTPANPLFPRFVRSALEPGGRPLLDVLAEETIDEAAVRSAVGRAKALGDAIDAEREEREARLQSGGLKPSTSVDRVEEQCFDHPPRLPSAIRLAFTLPFGQRHRRVRGSNHRESDPSVPGGARADQPPEDPPHQRSRTDP